MQFLKNILLAINPVRSCRKYHIKIWQCPQFLFITMGVVIISSIFATDVVARKYLEPEYVALIVLGVTAILFIIGHFMINSFERMAQISIAKSEFISIISHQLRSPLSAVKWEMDLLQTKKINLTDQEIPTAIKEIANQNEYMISLVNDLLDVNRIEDGTLLLTPELFSIKQLTEKAIEIYTSLARTADVTVSLLAQDNLPNVFADKEKIKNVVMHMLDNAIRYSNKKGKVIITIENISGKVKFVITDEGIGISEKDSKNVFQKFFRGGESARYQTGGMGIGLYVAKSVIESSGGEIGFNSIEGSGATFWFTLPTSFCKK